MVYTKLDVQSLVNSKMGGGSDTMNELSLLGLLPPGPSSSRARASLMRDRGVRGEGRGEGGGWGETDKGGSEDSDARVEEEEDTRVAGISLLSPGAHVGPGLGGGRQFVVPGLGASHDSASHASLVCC
jgi:hypothetical protein